MTIAGRSDLMAKAHSTVLDVSGELLEPLTQQVLRSATSCLDLADGSEVYQAAVMSARLWGGEVRGQGREGRGQGREVRGVQVQSCLRFL